MHVSTTSPRTRGASVAGRVAAPAAAVVTTLVLAACGGVAEGSASKKVLTLLIASSGDAETDAVRAATDAWTEVSGTPVQVTAAADIRSERAAGLTDADVPTTYPELLAVAERLTTADTTGLVISAGTSRAGVFVVGNGGWWTNAENTAPEANTPEVIAGLTTLKDMLATGAVQLAPDAGARWGGEAFGTGAAAMTIEGGWLKGTLRTEYPDVEYTVVELPEGPAGRATLLFTQCWGVAAGSDQIEQAVELVDFLTAPEQQLAFADAFGVMPSRMSASADHQAAHPEDAAFISGGEYGRGPINVAGLQGPVAELNQDLARLGTMGVATIVEAFDARARAALG